MANPATRHADDEPAEVRATATFAIPKLGRFVDNLVKGWEDIVGKLDLNDGLHAFCGCSNGHPDHALLSNGGIEDPVTAKLLLESVRASKHATKRDILSKAQDTVRRFQSCAQGRVDRLVQVQPG